MLPIPAGLTTATLPTERPDWWTIRFTWETAPGYSHPRFTYTQRSDESHAIDCAVYMLDQASDRTRSIYLVQAHVQAPGSDRWRVVE
jgi:hypothetical protein